MPTNLILIATNYNDINLTNQKTYSNGAGYACNYLLDTTTSFSISTTTGSKIITCAIGDFTDLLGCDIQNNNVPVKKWLIGDAGEILEIDYIKSTTEAVLKQPCSWSLAGITFVVIDYWGSLRVEETTLENVDSFNVVGALINTKIGPLTMNIEAGQSFEFGQEPISVDLGSTGAQCQITVKYTN